MKNNGQYMGSSEDREPTTKVGRVIRKYGLNGMGEHLEAAWTGENAPRTSLRDLADEFNRSLLETAIRDAGGTATDYDIQTAYRVLTDEDVSKADTLRKERELERDGVSIDEIRQDFVTHQAIHTYLTDSREAELNDQSVDPEEKIETLERLEGRNEAVAESTLSSLVDVEAVTDRDYELFVEIRAVCEECGTDYTLVDLIARGGCNC